jgi:hypothetical protein
MNNTIDINKLSVVELKALVYDKVNLIERVNQEIKFLNEEISKRAQLQANPKKMEDYKSPEEVEATPTEEEIDETVDELVADEPVTE